MNVNLNLVNVPKAKKDFVPLSWHNVIENDIKAGDRIFYLLGATGTGKSEWATQYAAKEGIPFLQISCKPGQEIVNWVGMERIVTKEFRNEIPTSEGKMVLEGAAPVQQFCIGPLAYCIENRSVILIDEPNYLLPTEKAVFQELLNNGHMTVLEANNGQGRTFIKHPDTIIILAANPTTYAGTQVENLSFINRIHSVIFVPDWSQDEIHNFVIKHIENNYNNVFGAKMKQVLAKYLSKIYVEVKKVCKEQEIPYDISIRQVMGVIRKLTVNKTDIVGACMRTIVNGMYINNLSIEAINAVRGVVELNAGNCQAEVDTIKEEIYGEEKNADKIDVSRYDDNKLEEEMKKTAQELAEKYAKIIAESYKTTKKSKK